MINYLFRSERLGFRDWQASDLHQMVLINMDPDVMRYFPSTQDEITTATFIRTMQAHLQERGFCYFAVDLLETGEFIGFIGLMYKDFEAAFTPCIDIGWRLGKQYWYKGLATEGAKRCLDYAFEELKIPEVYAMAPAVNLPSISVMKKIGMNKIAEFIHPAIADDERLRNCVLYLKPAAAI